MIKKNLLGLFFTLLLSSSVFAEQSSTPTQIVTEYYQALNSADLEQLKALMTTESFHSDMKNYAQSIALNDVGFHTILRDYSQSDIAQEIVQDLVKNRLRSIEDKEVVLEEELNISESIALVRLKEDGKHREIYLQEREGEWKINYLAGLQTN